AGQDEVLVHLQAVGRPVDVVEEDAPHAQERLLAALAVRQRRGREGTRAERDDGGEPPAHGRGQICLMNRTVDSSRPMKCQTKYMSTETKPEKNAETGVTSLPNVRSVPRSMMRTYSGVPVRMYSKPCRSESESNTPSWFTGNGTARASA